MPRLFYKKSKAGCECCRARKVKCDEAWPECGSCRRHDVACVYAKRSCVSVHGNVPESNRPTILTAPATSVLAENTSATSPSDIPDESSGRRYRELHLLQVFLVDICPTLPGAHLPLCSEVWTTHVPALAMEYKPLLHSIMAISTMYLSCEKATSSFLPADQLIAYGAQYLDITLQSYRRTLGLLEPHVADAACFTSIILGLHALASLRGRQLKPYAPPIQWLKMCNGVKSVFESNLDLVRGNPEAKINLDYGAPVIEPSALSESNLSRSAYLLFGQMEKWDNDSNWEVYKIILCYLGALLAAVECGEERRVLYCRITISPVFWPLRYIELVELRQPRALILLAHYFAIAGSCGKWWWIGESPPREISAIAGYLGQDWRTELAWPLAKVGLNHEAC